MACDASLPGHPILLPHECENEEERFQHVVMKEEMSFCPYHYAVYCSIVMRSFSVVVGDMFDNLNVVMGSLEEGLDDFMRILRAGRQ